MIKPILVAVAALALVPGEGLAEPKKIPSHQPEWTDHNDSDPGVSAQKRISKSSKLAVKSKSVPVDSVQPELSKIVVLCASEQEEQFEKEWSQYVSKKKLHGAELKETIAWVSEEAAEKRQRERLESGEKLSEEDWLEKRRAFMSEVAEKALNPAR